MRYKNLISDKLVAVTNKLKTLKFMAERGQIGEYREIEIVLLEQLEEIQSLINTNDEEY